MGSFETFTGTLKQHRYSLTTARRAVFEALSHSHEGMTMTSLVSQVADTADRASVYRSVELFERLGIVQRIQIGWKYKLELSDAFNPHHHHIHCADCGQVISLPEDPALERYIHKLAHAAGFQLTAHQLELSGLCEQCHKK